MPSYEQWFRLFKSNNSKIKQRAADNLLRYHVQELPFNYLLDILDNHYWPNDVLDTILERQDPELFDAMVSRLNSKHKETAVRMLRQNIDANTALLVYPLLDDPDFHVRLEAANTLMCLKDLDAIQELKKQYLLRLDNDVNIRMRLEWARSNLHVDIALTQIQIIAGHENK